MRRIFIQRNAQEEHYWIRKVILHQSNDFRVGITLPHSLTPSILNFQKRFCAIKNYILYWYKSETSQAAQNSISIKKIKEIKREKDVEFILETKKKNYKFKAESSEEREKWIRILELNKEEVERSNSTEKERFTVKNPTYERKSGKSFLKSYEIMFENIRRAEEEKRIKQEKERQAALKLEQTKKKLSKKQERKLERLERKAKKVESIEESKQKGKEFHERTPSSSSNPRSQNHSRSSSKNNSNIMYDLLHIFRFIYSLHF